MPRVPTASYTCSMSDSIVRTVQCAYCLRHSVNVTYETGLDDGGRRVETEVDRGRCSTPGCIEAKLPPR